MSESHPFACNQENSTVKNYYLSSASYHLATSASYYVIKIMEIDKISFNDISIFHPEEELPGPREVRNGCGNSLLNRIAMSKK